jgi:hypothetical protein
MPTPTYTPLATVTLGSSASSVTFSSIPATYRDLIIVVNAQCDGLGAANYRANGDSGSNYPYVTLRNNGSTPSSGSGTFTQFVAQDASATSGTRIMSVFQIMDYSATDKHKTGLARASYNQNSNGADVTEANAVRWANTAAINSLQVLSSNPFVAGSTFNLYGVIA